MAKPKTFYEVVQAAVAYFAEHGYESEDALLEWTERIRKAAERTLPSEQKMQGWLKDGLLTIYKKLIDRGDAVQIHEGVSKFTIDKIKPELRLELDKRIMASAQLIKLNRKKAIDQTLARFTGWTTSIPAGGTTQGKRKETTDHVKKAMYSLPFEERRLLTDQGHKLSASINEVIAQDTGAIAMVWHSNWRQKNYDYREDHKERDLHVYLVRDSWAHKKGLVKPGEVGFYGDTTKVAEEPFCRCYAKWLTNLSSLPDSMLTAKGKEALASAKAKLAS